MHQLTDLKNRCSPKNLLVFGFFLFSLCANSRTRANAYVENRGQLIDQNNNAVPDVKFILSNRGINVQLRSTGFSYDCYTAKENNTTENSKVEYNYQRIDIEFIAANIGAELVPSGMTGETKNYYTAGASYTTLQVRSYKLVTYKSIYPHIDLEFAVTREGNCKYQFIVHPNGNVQDIQMQYQGVRSTYIDGNALHLVIDGDTLIEHIPISYELENGKEVDVAFENRGRHTYGYTLATWNPFNTIVIDPAPRIKWATYFGGLDAEYIQNSCILGNYIYFCGHTESNTNIATTGAYQVSFGGYWDGFFGMMDSLGQLIWSSYYGGTGFESLYGIAHDGNDLYLCGTTYSNTGISTPGVHQSSFGGIADGFILKCDTTGARIWCTYYGGSSHDVCESVYCFGTSVFIGGNTESTNWIGTSGTHQPSLAGNSDGFILKLNSAGGRDWCTYYGGGSSEDVNSVVCDSNFVYATGWTYSNTQIATAGAHQTSINNNSRTDAFLVKLDTNGVRVWATYYGGSEYDGGYEVMIHHNSIFLVGHAQSSTGIASSGAYQTVHSGATDDAFIARFTFSGVRLWGTYYGGGLQDECTGVAPYGHDIIVAGTAESSGLASSGAYQTSIAGGFDAFIAVFDTSGNRKYASYFGGPLDEYLVEISSWNETWALTGGTYSTSGIDTNAIYQNTNEGLVDGFIFYMGDPCIYFSLLTNITPDSGNCDGTATAIIAGGTQPYQYNWSNGDTTPVITGLCPGIYTVSVTDSNNCSVSATITMITGIQDSQQYGLLSLFPNPADQNITLRTTGMTRDGSYEIINLLGEKVAGAQIENDATILSTSNIMTGYYIIKVYTGNNVVSRPFIVKH